MSFLKSISSKPDRSFKLFFWKFFFGYLPIGLLISFLSLFEVNPVVFNEEPVVGIKGFMVGLLMIPLIVLAITIMVWLLFTVGNSIINLLVRLGRNN